MTSKELFDAWYHPNFFTDPKTLAWEAWKQSRKNLEAEQAQAAEPHGWMICGLREVMSEHHAKAEQAQHQAIGGTAVAYPIYTHPARPATGERAELIRELRSRIVGDPFPLMDRAADMLEADAQEIEGWKADQKENLGNQVELQGRINDLQAQQVAVTAWKAEQIDDFEIRVTSPEGESWRLRSADRNDIFNNFIWRWAQSMMTAKGDKP